MNVQQLRNSILQEAIEGRLVPQDPNDEPASVLLNRIREEKKRLVKEGKLKKKDLEETPISEDEKPFEIPDSWEWCRIGDIFEHASGKQQSSNNKKIGTLQKYITTSNLYWDSFVLDTLKEMYFSDEELKTCSATKGDLLVCEGGAGYGRSAIWSFDYDICLQNHVHRLRPYIDGVCRYVYYLIFLLKESNRLVSVGTAMPGLSANRLKEIAVPLPPLAEQKRIVAKIEELLPKVEEYGKAQDALNKLNEELPEKLKKSVLQEAITGKLVPQDPNDEPASVLLNRIREEKKQLVKAGKLKKKDLEETPISEDEKPFDIPDSWEWVKLYDCVSILYGYPFESNMFNEDGFGFPLIRIRDVLPARTKTYTTEVADERYVIKKGDMLVGMDGNFNVRFWNSEPAYLNQRVCKIETKEEVLFQKFLYYYFPIALEEIFKSVSYVTVKHLSDKHLRTMYIPLPPLAEQKRIVAKIEEVFKEIDKLKA